MTTAMDMLEGIKAELSIARQEAQQQKATAARAEKDLAAEKVAWGKDQVWGMEVEETLKGVYEARDSLQAMEENAS